MPPKRVGRPNPKETNTAKPVATEEKADVQTNTSVKNETEQATAADKPSNKKRKKASDENDGSSKAQRRSGRGAQKSTPSQLQLLIYMLTKDAEELCRPDEESEYIKSHGAVRTYSTGVLNPFEELLAAVILSRPISHRLGLRTIRTILNAPYSFVSAKAVQKAGNDKQHQAVWDAKTQHKAKTADEIGQIAEVVLEKFTAGNDKDGTQLQKLLDESKGDTDDALDTLRKNIKGLGPTGLNIFLRRVQWLWSNGFPYVDDRTSLSLRKVGLPEDAEDLQKAVEDQWSKLPTKDLAGDDEAAKKRRAFVTILERAIGSDLEGKSEALVDAAAASS